MKRLIITAIIILFIPAISYAFTFGSWGKSKFTVVMAGDGTALGAVSGKPAIQYYLESRYESTEYTYENIAHAGDKPEQTATLVRARVNQSPVPKFMIVLVGTESIDEDNESFTDNVAWFNQMRTDCAASGTRLIVCQILPRAAWTSTNNSNTILLWNTQLIEWADANGITVGSIYNGMNIILYKGLNEFNDYTPDKTLDELFDPTVLIGGTTVDESTSILYVAGGVEKTAYVYDNPTNHWIDSEEFDNSGSDVIEVDNDILVTMPPDNDTAELSVLQSTQLLTADGVNPNLEGEQKIAEYMWRSFRLDRNETVTRTDYLTDDQGRYLTDNEGRYYIKGGS